MSVNKIIGLYFSPRIRGNSFLILKHIERNTNRDIETININDKDIKECKACYVCLEADCSINDEFNKIIEKIINADLIIIATPVYILGPNSVFKKFTDRFISLFNKVEKIYNKPVILISIAGVKDVGEGYSPLALIAPFEATGFKIKESIVLYGALPGEILIEKDNLDKIEYIINLIKNNENKKDIKENICQYCSSRYFEIKNDSLKCLICKSEYKLKEGELLPIKKSEIFFGSIEKLKEHKRWLIGMKEKYLEKRKEIKEIIKKYTE